MPDAIFVRPWDQTRVELAASLGAGELRQEKDGRAGFYQSPTGATTGDFVLITTSGQVTVKKASGFTALNGGRAYWDHSANEVTYKPSNDRDFFAGTFVGDFGSGDTQCVINLNVQPVYLLDIARDPFISALVGTVAVSGCNIFRRGGAHNFVHNSTNEAQKLDALSVAGFDPDANWIVEGAFRVVSDGAGTAPDVSLGIANGTHATDADSITESCFIHLNGNEVNIYAESDDGTNEVAATDTTIDYTEGSALSSRVEFWMDGRDPADIQIYIEGALVLGASTFRLDNATGPLFLLAHTEKSAAADVYELALDWLRVRIAEQ